MAWRIEARWEEGTGGGCVRGSRRVAFLSIIVFIVLSFLCLIVEQVPGPSEFRESSIISVFILHHRRRLWSLLNACVSHLLFV